MMGSYKPGSSGQTAATVTIVELPSALDAVTTSRQVRQAVLDLFDLVPSKESTRVSEEDRGQFSKGRQSLLSLGTPDLNGSEDVRQAVAGHMGTTSQLYQQLFSDTLRVSSTAAKFTGQSKIVQSNTNDEVLASQEELKAGWWKSSMKRLELLEVYLSIFSQAQDKIDSWLGRLKFAQNSQALLIASLDVQSVFRKLQESKLQAITTELDLLYLRSLTVQQLPDSSVVMPSAHTLEALIAELPTVVNHNTHTQFFVPWHAYHNDLRAVNMARILASCAGIEEVVAKLVSAVAVYVDLSRYDHTLSRLLVDTLQTDAHLGLSRPVVRPGHRSLLRNDNIVTSEYRNDEQETEIASVLGDGFQESESCSSCAVIDAVLSLMSLTCRAEDTRNSSRELCLKDQRQLCELSSSLDALALEWQNISHDS